MRIGFYDPYIETLGGGEKYLLTMLRAAIGYRGAEATLLSPVEPPVREFARLNVPLRRGAFRWIKADDDRVPALSEPFDVFVTMHNGVPPESRARRSVAHIQFPFEAVAFGRRRDFLNPVRSVTSRHRQLAAIRSYDRFVVNSEFTKRHVARRLHADNILVIPPPIDEPAGKPIPKEPVILAVGRFITHGHPKKQDILIEAFRKLQERPAAAGWSLHLIGGTDGSAATKRYLSELRRAARGLPVEFHLNAPHGVLTNWYRRAAVFWHATGAGEDEQRFPERLEHFGITTAEAMSYAAVPVAIARGGQPEIVTPGTDGFLWETPAELVDRTAELIGDGRKRATMSRNAARKARQFSTKRFIRRIRNEVLAV